MLRDHHPGFLWLRASLSRSKRQTKWWHRRNQTKPWYLCTSTFLLPYTDHSSLSRRTAAVWRRRGQRQIVHWQKSAISPRSGLHPRAAHARKQITKAPYAAQRHKALSFRLFHPASGTDASTDARTAQGACALFLLRSPSPNPTLFPVSEKAHRAERTMNSRHMRGTRVGQSRAPKEGGGEKTRQLNRVPFVGLPPAATRPRRASGAAVVSFLVLFFSGGSALPAPVPAAPDTGARSS